MAQNAFAYRGSKRHKRKGVHSKTKVTRNKNSKNYQKKYRGQGKP